MYTHTRVISVCVSVCVGPPNVLTLETLFKLPICYSSCCWVLRLFGSLEMGRAAIDSTPPPPIFEASATNSPLLLLFSLSFNVIIMLHTFDLPVAVSPICLAALSQNP